MLSSGSRASTPLKKEADSIRAKLEELGEDAAEVCVCVCVCLSCVCQSFYRYRISLAGVHA